MSLLRQYDAPPGCRRHHGARRGRQIVESGVYAPSRGEYLGRVEFWGVDVFDNSPQEWLDALFDEAEQQETPC